MSLSHPGHTEKFFKLAKKTKKLTTVEVSGSGLEDASGKYVAECIAENKQITYLAIRRSKMHPKDINGMAPIETKYKSSGNNCGYYLLLLFILFTV